MVVVVVVVVVMVMRIAVYGRRRGEVRSRGVYMLLKVVGNELG